VALTCARATHLSLAAVGGHASAAERLELESHLASCARCAAAYAALAPVRALREAAPEGLGPSARERVRRAILARPPAVAAPRPRLGWPLAVGAVAALGAIASVWIAGGSHADLRVVRGDVVMAAAPGAGAQGDRRVTLRSQAGGVVKLGDATTMLAPTTEIVWRADRHSMELHEGRVTVDVPHRPGQRFEVRTSRFVVEVIGTRFVVELGGVRTERGMVRVLSSDGKLIGYVGEGRSWAVPPVEEPAPTPPVVDVPAPPAAAPVVADDLPKAPVPPPVRAPVPVQRRVVASARVAPSGGDEESPLLRLERARRALAHGNAEDARRTVEPAFRAGRPLAAEARAIYAESFLIEGRYADAIEAYQLVARDFSSTPQAESALYAVAQLEIEHGRSLEARVALNRYLSRYPRGRFAKEAADRLEMGTLGGSPNPPATDSARPSRASSTRSDSLTPATRSQ
jgi:ferric-dicitrate binding protein FerR (iron transport regulator)